MQHNSQCYPVGQDESLPHLQTTKQTALIAFTLDSKALLIKLLLISLFLCSYFVNCQSTLSASTSAFLLPRFLSLSLSLPPVNMLTIVNDSYHGPRSRESLHPRSQGVDIQALGAIVLASVVLHWTTRKPWSTACISTGEDLIHLALTASPTATGCPRADPTGARSPSCPFLGEFAALQKPPSDKRRRMTHDPLSSRTST